jgi:hypothetical protein
MRQVVAELIIRHALHVLVCSAIVLPLLQRFTQITQLTLVAEDVLVIATMSKDLSVTIFTNVKMEFHILLQNVQLAERYRDPWIVIRKKLRHGHVPVASRIPANLWILIMPHARDVVRDQSYEANYNVFVCNGYVYGLRF